MLLPSIFLIFYPHRSILCTLWSFNILIENIYFTSVVIFCLLQFSCNQECFWACLNSQISLNIQYASIKVWSLIDIYVFVCQREREREREIADFGSVSSYFQSPSMQLAMKQPNMEPHNVCFSIIKKWLAALHVWERLLGTVVRLWKANWTETHVLVPLQLAGQKSSLIIMILVRSDCILLLNGLAQIHSPKNNPAIPKRGI